MPEYGYTQDSSSDTPNIYVTLKPVNPVVTGRAIIPEIHFSTALAAVVFITSFVDLVQLLMFFLFLFIFLGHVMPPHPERAINSILQVIIPIFIIINNILLQSGLVVCDIYLKYTVEKACRE